MYCISHVALSVSNLDNSVEFYKKFGFKISREWSAADDSLRIVHLLLNGLLLELFCYKNFNSLTLTEPQGQEQKEKVL